MVGSRVDAAVVGDNERQVAGEVEHGRVEGDDGVVGTLQRDVGEAGRGVAGTRIDSMVSLLQHVEAMAVVGLLSVVSFLPRNHATVTGNALSTTDTVNTGWNQYRCRGQR